MLLAKPITYAAVPSHRLTETYKRFALHLVISNDPDKPVFTPVATMG